VTVVYKRFHCFLPTAFDLTTAVVALNSLPRYAGDDFTAPPTSHPLLVTFNRWAYMRVLHWLHAKFCVSLTVRDGLMYSRTLLGKAYSRVSVIYGE